MAKVLQPATDPKKQRRRWALGGMMALAIAGGAVLLPDTAPAATLAVTPSTIDDVLARASNGDTIRLAPGDYGPIRLRGRNWAPAISIEAGEANLAGVKLETVTGFHWRGGHFDGGEVRGGGFAALRNSNDVRIEAATFTGFTRNGIAVDSSADIDIIGNKFSDSGSDGIQIGQSRRMTIDGNSCVAFKPTEKAHPDCIQMWSRPTSPPTADIIIRNNVMNGRMQGISLFNHKRKGVDDGGFDRITIIGNDVAISDFYHGIVAYSCRDCLIRDNKVRTLPGANPKIHAWLRMVDSGTAKLCANTVGGSSDGGGDRRCKADVPMAVARR